MSVLEKTLSAQLSKWAALLGELQFFDPDLHIAGGALRDLRCQRPIKDVDIFMEYGNVSRHVKVKDKLRAMGYHMVAQFGEDYFTHAPNTKVVDYWQRDEELPVNVIFQKNRFSLDEQLKRFDFGICQIGFNGVQVVSTDFFLQDMSEEKFTLRSCENSDQYYSSLQRYERLKEKYEEWPLVVPEQFKKFEMKFEDAEQYFVSVCSGGSAYP